MVVFLLILSPIFSFATPEENISSRLSGRILLDTSNNGEAWYLNPKDLHRYYLGRPRDAINIMKNLSLGVSNEFFDSMSENLPKKLWGKILIKPHDLGKAFYINPSNGEAIYLGDPKTAFFVMRNYSQGINSNDLEQIPVAEINTENNEKIKTATSNKWQYLGWWGKINTTDVPVHESPTASSSILGYLNTINRIKVLEEKSGTLFNGSNLWYMIDGGQYPGAFINSSYVEAIPQPTPESNPEIPKEIKEGEFWVDVNIEKQVLTLFKFNEPVFATYVSTGRAWSPTVRGTYRIWVKLKKGGMSGGPPLVPYTYNLVDVPWIMYYKGSFAIHGTYWHDEFGTVRSAGCTNLTQGDAEHIFSEVLPLTSTKNETRPSENSLGTIVYNH